VTGAYTAKPAVIADPPVVPPGWNPDWPFPGPLPPGYDPVYAISFKSPPTPDDVGINEEITVRVKVYQEGIGDPPSQLGTIQPNENIDWLAFIDDIEIASSSEGWTYISGRYYSSWTFTPPLFPEDVTEPPKIMTVTAEGVMNNGSFSSPLSAEEGIDVVEKMSFVTEATIDSYVVSGDPAAWTVGVGVALGISIGGVSVGYWTRLWRVDKDNGTFHEYSSSNSGALPEGIVWTQDVPNRKLTLTIPKDSFDPTHEYYILTSSDSSKGAFGSLTINISTRVQFSDAGDVLLSEMNASGSGSVPPNSSLVEVSKYDIGGRELSLDGVLGLFSGATITNYE